MNKTTSPQKTPFLLAEEARWEAGDRELLRDAGHRIAKLAGTLDVESARELLLTLRNMLPLVERASKAVRP